MKLEYLANELLFDIFEYFNAIDLFYSFYDLNSRFNILLCVHFQNYHLDFRSVSKYKFDFMCKQYLSIIIDRVVSLYLSNSDETPNLPDYFLSYGFTLHRFTYLRSLSFLYLCSIETIIAMLNNSSFPPYLTRLKITDYISNNNDHIDCLINSIWCLPKLTHCHLNPYFIEHDYRFNGLKTISSSIKYISLKNFAIQSNDLSNIFMHTPHLQHLRVTLDTDPNNGLISILSSSLTILKINVISQHTMIQLLQGTPNLRYLTIETRSFYWNGHEWKRMIVTYLPRLKVFRLRMYFSFTNDHTTEKEVDELLDTFRTDFWLNEHHWYVRCEWNPFHEDDGVTLYTLPYYSYGILYVLDEKRQIKSTCPDDRVYWSYDKVHTIVYDSEIENSSLALIRFPNISYLQINLPLPKKFWTIISTLNHLTSLQVLSLIADSTELQLQTLFDQASHLYSLIIEQESVLQLTQLQFIYSPIRRLYLTNYNPFVDISFNAEQCSALANSLLVHQCEVLMITVKNRSHALSLIHMMPNLRSLVFKCQQDIWKYNQRSASLVEDNLVKWLKDHLPSTYSVNRDPVKPSTIRLWIYR